MKFIIFSILIFFRSLEMVAKGYHAAVGALVRPLAQSNPNVPNLNSPQMVRRQENCINPTVDMRDASPTCTVMEEETANGFLRAVASPMPMFRADNVVSPMLIHFAASEMMVQRPLQGPQKVIDNVEVTPIPRVAIRMPTPSLSVQSGPEVTAAAAWSVGSTSVVIGRRAALLERSNSLSSTVV
jgi:hypothetical protein